LVNNKFVPKGMSFAKEMFTVLLIKPRPSVNHLFS